MSNKAILFPAFVREYSGIENVIVKNLFPHFKFRLKQASEITGTDLTSFDFETNNFLDNELKSQYISYLFSCELSDYLHKSAITFDYTAGYSMGIYSMFYYTGSISRDNGLKIIKKAYESVLEIIQNNIFGMGNIIGLNLTDINNILRDEDAEIINVNGSHNFFISGKLPAIQNILEKAKTEGALHARILPVGCPYHSSFIRRSTIDFGNFIYSLEIKSPQITVISCIDQHEIMDTEGVKMELINNLVTPLNWQNTVIKLNSLGAGIFYECGAGMSLYKLNKFIPGNHSTLKFNLTDKLSVY